MKPRVAALVAQAAAEHGVSADAITEGKRRTERVTQARWSVIAALYDPASRQVGQRCRLIWGLSTIGRELNLDHTSVLHAVKQMGLHEPVAS